MKVPDTNTFSLQDVVDVINPTTDDLVDCFSDADPDAFDPSYEGSKNSLLNFRNYNTDYIKADPDSMSFINTDPDQQYADIICNTTFTVYDVSDAWIHQNVVGDTIFVGCDNNTGPPRNGTIMIRNDNDAGVTVTITIDQRPAP